MAGYRFLFSPIRYTSLPLAVIEALTIGMPVVALATTEIPTVLQNGVQGYISCDVDDLVAGMRRLLADPDEARRLGANARELGCGIESRISIFNSPRWHLTGNWDFGHLCCLGKK